MHDHGGCCHGGAKDNQGQESGGCCSTDKKAGCCAAMSACQNMCPVERVLRICVGLGLIALVFSGPQTPWGWVGIIPLATGIVGWCGLHALMGKGKCGPKGGDCCKKPE